MPAATAHRPIVHRPARQTLAGRAAAAVLALALAAACSNGERDQSPAAQVSAGAATDDIVSAGSTARQIAGYRLTNDRVERWFVAQENVDALVASDPTIENALGASRGWSRGGRAVDAAAERLAAEPRIREAIEAAGLTPRDFVMTALALHQALLAAGPGAPAELRRLAARNVRFVSANADVLRRYADQQPGYLATSPDSVPYDSLYGGVPSDSVVYDTAADPALLPPSDSVPPDSLPDPSLPPPPDSMRPAPDSLPVPVPVPVPPPTVPIPPIPPAPTVPPPGEPGA
jgi:hypothetical protein